VLFVTFFQISQQPRRFRKIQAHQIFFSYPWLVFEVVLARMQIRFKTGESPRMLTYYRLILNFLKTTELLENNLTEPLY